MRKSIKLWALFALIILILNSPLLLQTVGMSEGDYLGKVIAGDGDYPTYLAKMRIGYKGGWQYVNRYTTEPHRPTYIFLFYILLGHLARVLELNLHFVYHAARFILALIALRVLFAFIKKHYKEKDYPLVFFLAVFLSGTYFPEIDGAPQYHIYSGIMGYTHYMLTLTCLLKFFESVFDYLQCPRKVSYVQAAATLNILALVHPFMVVLAGLVMTGTVLATNKLRQAFPVLAVSALSSMPLMLYFYTIFTRNPVLAGWRAQAVTPQGPFALIFLFGLGSALAYATVIFWLRGKIRLDDSGKFFMVWLITALALSFSKLITSNTQWLFFASLPAAYLAYRFLGYLDGRGKFCLRIRGRSVIVWLLLIILVLPSFNTVLILNRLAFLTLLDKDKYHANIIPREDMACYSWLNLNAEENDIILAQEDIGNLIPFVTNSYTYLGHSHETINYIEKKEKVRKFMQGVYSPWQARQFLSAESIDYIILEKDQKTDYDFLTLIMRGRTIDLYQYQDMKPAVQGLTGEEDYHDLCAYQYCHRLVRAGHFERCP